MRTFVVPDLHGSWWLLWGLLEKAGLAEVADESGVRLRRGDVTVVQLGDVAQCSADTEQNDLAALAAVAVTADVLLVGNHELPYFGGESFVGFRYRGAVADAIKGLPWRAAHTVGNTLVTHAGVVPDLCLPYDIAVGNAELLNAAWDDLVHRASHPWFNQIGRERGGFAECGGVLWSDFPSEPRDSRFNQVFGHSILEDGPLCELNDEAGTWAAAIDVGGKNGRRIVGLWLDGDGGRGDVVEYVHDSP